MSDYGFRYQKASKQRNTRERPCFLPSILKKSHVFCNRERDYSSVLYHIILDINQEREKQDVILASDVKKALEGVSPFEY